MERILAIIFSLHFLLSGCSSSQADEQTPVPPENTGAGSNVIETVEVGDVEQITVAGKTVYLYVPQRIKNGPDKVPMVLFMCGTTCDPLDNLVDSGWVELAERERIIVISPDYNNYATYSETGFLISVVDHMLANYPIDSQRVYSTGFSNGGAASVALTRDYPQYFAAISAMGWMVDLDNRSGVFEAYDMPFQVVQGNGEFTVKTASGAMAVMQDEQESVRSLMLYNEMLSASVQPDYDQTPYWGYQPDNTYGKTMNGREWQFCNYYKEGYSAPFAQLVIVENSEHRPRSEEADVAWEFFKQYRRDDDGKILMEGELSMREFYDVPYAAQSNAQTLDLYLPETGNGPWPLVFFVHGGGWFSGDKQDGQELPWLTLRQHGYAVASVNYRLSREAPHPSGIEDCEAALRFLRENAASYHIDPNRIATAGGSSGGHYALMMALTMEDSGIGCCVAWYPATDLAETMRTVQAREYTGFGANFAWSNIERYVGKKISDVNDIVLVEANPIHYVSSDMPPVLLQHGNADTICPIDQSLRFREAVIKAAGEDRVSMTVLNGAEHGDHAFETEQNMAIVRDFLAQHL